MKWAILRDLTLKVSSVSLFFQRPRLADVSFQMTMRDVILRVISALGARCQVTMETLSGNLPGNCPEQITPPAPTVNIYFTLYHY